VTENAGALTYADRVRLEALRYAVSPEAAAYLAIMRTFTGGISGLLSDQSAAEVQQRLRDEHRIELDLDTVDDRLSFLVEHGNLARSPRETEARSIREYLRTRSRYQLTQRGETVHRHVEELLDSAETAREVSSEMLGALLAGLRHLNAYDEFAVAAAQPDDLAREITTLFAQFERLVDSTRDFYAYLSEVLRRFDLDREQFQAYKAALLDYLSRFVDEIQLHMPQIGDAIIAVVPVASRLVARANTGQRLVGLDGGRAKRARGLAFEDWPALRTWFLGEPGREADAAQVRRLATDAMGALLANLRRIVSSGSAETSRYRDLITLAGWFDNADDDTAHALWAAAFGLFSARHLGFAAEPVPPTTSWCQAPPAEVPVTLRSTGDRTMRGRPGRPADYSDAKARRLAEHDAAERRRRAALGELGQLRGRIGHAKLSDDARRTLLDLYGRALLAAGKPLHPGDSVTSDIQGAVRLVVHRTPGSHTVIVSPQGRLELVELSLDVHTAEAIEEATA